MSDSKYAVDSMNKWIPKWQENGWKTSSGKPVAHQDLLQDIHKLSRSREFQGDVKFTHVKGHAGNPGNENADGLAKYMLDNPCFDSD